MASSARVKPGKKSRIVATVDTEGKRGRIVKTVEVWTNDPSREKVLLKIVVDVAEDAAHQGAPSKTIFSEGCAECHVEKGRGKLGRDLFLEDCAMCHSQGEKNIGQPVSILRRVDRGHLRQVIQEGTPGPMMPGFGREKGGPLGEEEIESLIRYIKGEE